jgi:hypothetical protein
LSVIKSEICNKRSIDWCYKGERKMSKEKELYLGIFLGLAGAITWNLYCNSCEKLDFIGLPSGYIIDYTIPPSRSKSLLFHLQQLNKEILRKQKSAIFYLRFETGTQTERTFVHQSVESRMKYIQENSVRAGIVEKPEYYMCSSIKNYAGLEGLIAQDYW